MGSHTTTRRDKGWSYYHAKRKRYNWHGWTFAAIAVVGAALLWWSANGTGWAR